VSRPQQSFTAPLGVGLGTSLLDRAIERLAGGPVDTAVLAEEVLKLRGNPRAAAAAVFALLGTDRRVQVDGEGVWSLVTAPGRPAGGLLRDEEWVVVDVETTGGSPAHGHRVIEIAAVRVAGGEVLDSYSTLVDPGRPIPRMITSLTGIDDAMIAGAPRFEEVAGRVSELLDGRVFVAHNVPFDARFVTAELERCGCGWPADRQLCTLRLARRMLPHLPSRSLGALAEFFGVGMDTHHRALDDAVATARLLLRFLGDLEERGVQDWVALDAYFRARSGRRRRPSALPRSMDQA
jgi:DNA polymerase III subunit epsilon